LRIRRLRKRNQSWIAILASGFCIYVVLAVGFHWFLEPAILASRSSLPTETFVAYPDRSSQQPSTSGQSLRGVSQASPDQREPTTPADEMTTAAIEAPREAPRKELKTNVTRKISARPIQQAVERRSPSLNFSSSPASPNFR
jgi:hypothetical protein